MYDRIAPLFSATREFNWADAEVLAEYIKPGSQVLDLGCGNGRLYQILAKKQVKYVGLDQSAELIKLAKEKNPGQEFVVGDMTSLDFSAQLFDAVIGIASFNHIPGQELQLKTLKEMARVLKPGGQILMTNWNLHSESAQKNIKKHNWKNWQETPGQGIDVLVPWKNPQAEILGERFYHGFTAEELTNLAQSANLEVVDIFYSHKGQRLDQTTGANILSIFKK